MRKKKLFELYLCLFCKGMFKKNDLYHGYNRSISRDKIMYNVCLTCQAKPDFNWTKYNELSKMNSWD